MLRVVHGGSSSGGSLTCVLVLVAIVATNLKPSNAWRMVDAGSCQLSIGTGVFSSRRRGPRALSLRGRPRARTFFPDKSHLFCWH